MKKILSLIAVAVLTMVAWAAGSIAYAASENNVVENFTATGVGFKHTVDIDWSTQKVVAEIDLSTCTGTLENIFSIGKDIAEWNGTCYHLYYTAATNSLEVDFCTSDGNPVRVENITGISGTIKVEVVNNEGLYVNGTLYNKNSSGAVESSLSQLFALSSIQVGGCQGDNMSHATYKYIKVVNTATEPQPEPETGTKYTEPLFVNFAVGEGETGETNADPAYAMFNTTADGGCEVTFKGVYALDGDNNSAKFGDIKLKFAEKSTEVSSKGIAYDLYSNSEPTTVTITAADSEYNGVEFTLNARFSKFITFTKDEQQHAYGMAYLTGKKDGKDLVLLLTFGETDPSAFEPEVTQVVDDMKVTFNGTTTPMTDKTMELNTTAMEGFYDLKFKDFTIGTTVVGDLYVQGLLFDVDETTGEVTLDEEELDGEWSNVNTLVGGVLGLKDGGHASITTLKGTAKYNAEDGTFSDFHFTFTIADLNGSPVEVEFGKEAVTPEPPATFVNVCEEGYLPNGKPWMEERRINWDKQYVEAEIDLSDVGYFLDQDILSVGEDIKEWKGNCFHFLYSKSKKELQVVLHSGTAFGIYTTLSNIEGVVKIKISKDNGLEVNGKKCNEPYLNQQQDLEAAFTKLFALNKIQIGSVYGTSRSYAKYNYVRIYGEGDTTVGINNVANTTLNGEAQIFSIDGVKLSSMQKGINIVRTAEGKTIKVIK